MSKVKCRKSEVKLTLDLRPWTFDLDNKRLPTGKPVTARKYINCLHYLLLPC